jgi:hypothetical protein
VDVFAFILFGVHGAFGVHKLVFFSKFAKSSAIISLTFVSFSFFSPYCTPMTGILVFLMVSHILFSPFSFFSVLQIIKSLSLSLKFTGSSVNLIFHLIIIFSIQSLHFGLFKIIFCQYPLFDKTVLVASLLL